mmetsp:Transcript_7036/g.16012  ORF Transcript_7036/g.16012 Transcript_7036/m.16012 type:complete len:137 (+) Transcript_7036:78-488(+)|eukprot:CAMPEP_0172303018 /NCGR_PEP_ID=MMETSP1058-20130122/4619_1 /TAXON_ID=83371 /ORGANISM="Detonula confervacea, Strain CCMP 353" /LENGTH=136 /DNA_ID=CAMNT_0013013695 /DNA_START=64 /DNA_END=474 /DNA_ORIENTATION=+
MMKIAILAALVGSAAAFAPAVSRTACMSSLSAMPGAAKSPAEDIELTLKVIMENMAEDDGADIDDSDDDTPDEAPAPAAAAAAAPASSGVELWSVDYQAAARLAYEAAGSEGDFAAFNTKYLADTSAMIAKKGMIC